MICREDKLNSLINCKGLKMSKATLISNIIENSIEINGKYKRSAVIIVPGGGYEFISEREASPIAQKFIANDITAFILKYSVEKEDVYPLQLLEIAAAVAYVRKNAENFNIDKDKIILAGFSAGGHLAANLAVQWNNSEIFESLNINYEDNKPNALILSYPVITSGEFAHKGSIINLLGDLNNKENLDNVSLEKKVSNLTPPTFIWHTMQDDVVPVENSILFMEALRKYNVPFEIHIFTKGNHGLSLADKTTANIKYSDQVNEHVAQWFGLCIQWINELFNK